MAARGLAFGLASVAVVVCAGCGLGLIDAPGGRDSQLPTQGAGPYTKIEVDLATPADEPYVVARFPVFIRDPSALAEPDGSYRLWFSYHENPAGHDGAIWTARLAAFSQLPAEGPAPALAADQPWERGAVSAPCVVRVGGDELAMFYQGGVDAPAIGLARSTDGGATWNKHAANPLAVGLAAPTVAELPGGGWLMYASRPDRSAIVRLQSSDSIDWRADADPVLVARRGVADAFDRDGVADPWLVVRPTATDSVHHALFYSGVLIDDPDERPRLSIGWAGSFDGLSFQRFGSPDGPVLDPGGTSEQGPSVLLEPTGGVMFFSESHRGVQSIAVAVHP